LTGKVVQALVCSRYVSNVANLDQCTVEGLSTSCLVNSLAAGNFANVDECVCLDYKLPDGRPQGQIGVCLKDSWKEYLLENWYYTSDWEAELNTKYVCNNVGKCCCGHCSGNNPNDISAGGNFELVPFPGQSVCFGVDGGWTNNCADFGQACLFTRWVVRPKGTVYGVKGIKSPSVYVANISITITDDLGERTSYLSAIQGGNVDTDDWNLRITTISSGSETVLPGNALACSQLACHFSDASLPNTPESGKVGDIQSNTFQMSLPIAIDNKMAAIQHTVKYASGFFPKPGILKKGQVIPSNMAGLEWEYDQNYLRGHMVGGLGVSFELSTNRLLKITSNRASGCPVAEYIDAFGFFSSSKGASVKFNAKSSCGPGAVLIKVSDSALKLGQSLIVLEDEFQEFEIKIYTPYVNNDFELTLYEGKKEAAIHVVFTADKDVVIQNTTTDIVGSDTQTEGSVLGSLYDWFGGSKFWTWFSLGAAPLLFAIAAALILKCLCDMRSRSVRIQKDS
jgi:hypothetical protein